MDANRRLLFETHLKALRAILDEAKTIPAEKINEHALKSILERSQRSAEDLNAPLERYLPSLNLKFLLEHNERVLRTLLTQPKLSQKEMQRQAAKQMGLDPQRKFSKKPKT